MNHRLLVTGLAVLATPAIAVLTVSNAGSAFATPVNFGVTVGLPDAASGSGQSQAGRLDLHLTGGGTQLLDEEKLGLTPAGQDGHSRFGSVIVIRDLNGDGYDDMVVGAPGSTGATGANAPGRVDILFGSKTGISTTGAITLPTPARPGDRFGTALALSPRGDNSNGVDLWVGAPDHAVAGKAEAGAIFRYSITATGAVSYVETITQDSPLVPGSSEAGDHFGAVLADDAFNSIVVGVPDEDIGTVKDAGTVQMLRTDQTTNALAAGADSNQNSKGVAGTAEAGDHFGAALTVGADAVGVPGEDVGKLKDAGEVQTYGRATADCQSRLQLCPSKDFTQNSAGIPGIAEAGDRFGAALSQGIFRRVGYRCAIYPSVAIGSPGEDIGTVKDAGSVTTFMLPGFADTDDMRGCPAIMLSQGDGLPGTSEAGDELGATMGTVPGDQFDDDDQTDAIVSGVPGEDIGSIKDAGRVLLGTGTAAKSYAAQGGDRAGQHFGSVLSTYQAIILNI